MKKLVTLLMVVMMSFILFGCSNNADNSADKETETNTVDSIDDQVLTPGKLVVGTSPDYPPFESYDIDGNIVGYDIDMINELVKSIKTEDGKTYEVEFVAMDFDMIISALQTGQLDIGVSAFSYNPERQCDFTDSYYASGQAVVVLANSGIETTADLNGKTVAAGESTMGYEEASKIEGVKMTSPGDYQQQFELLRANQIDAVVCDITVAEGYVNSSSDFKIIDVLSEEELCITVAKGNNYIVEALNNALSQFLNSDLPEQLKEKWGI